MVQMSLFDFSNERYTLISITVVNALFKLVKIKTKNMSCAFDIETNSTVKIVKIDKKKRACKLFSNL